MQQKPKRVPAKKAARRQRNPSGMAQENRERLIVIEEVLKPMARSIDAQSRRMDGMDEKHVVCSAKLAILEQRWNNLLLIIGTLAAAYGLQGLGKDILTTAMKVLAKAG